MTNIVVPFEQEGTKAVVRSWLRSVGDTVAENDPLVELETDKVTQEVPAPCAGVLVEIMLDTDAEATPGAVLGRLAAGIDVPASPIAPATTASTPVDAATEPRLALSPAVRRAVLQHGIEPSTLKGTGRGGRLTRADVDKAAAERENQPEPPTTSSTAIVAPRAAEVTPERVERPAAFAGVPGTRIVPHDRMRLAIAQNMLNSVTTAPHVTAVFECDFTAVTKHRSRHKEAFARQGAGLTFTAYLVAAAVQAMSAAPTVNSRWFEDRLEIYDEVSIGVGTALGDEGLVVPVLASAQTLSLLGIAQRLGDLTARARARKLVPADMRGGTFTISNHGVSGSLFAAPIIINQPQSAILGVGKLAKRLVVREIDGVETIQTRPMAYVSLTIDHRALDGHQTNAWLTRFVEVMENWPDE